MVTFFRGPKKGPSGRLIFNGFVFNRSSFNGSVVILHLHCIMEDSEVFCPHFKDYVALRTFRRHKALYYKGERTWHLDVPSNSLSDEESSTPVNYDDDREEASYDEVFEFMGYETEGEDDDLPIWRGPATKKTPPFFIARALITRKIMRSRDAQCSTGE